VHVHRHERLPIDEVGAVPAAGRQRDRHEQEEGAPAGVGSVHGAEGGWRRGGPGPVSGSRLCGALRSCNIYHTAPCGTIGGRGAGRPFTDVLETAMKPSVPVLLTTLAAAACAVNPAAGEREFSLISEEQEIQMGREVDPQIVASFGLVDHEDLQAYVSGLGHE